MKILIAPNSFKECADSVETANIFEKYLFQFSDCECIKKPISDGGDGFVKVCAENFNLQLLTYQISSPFDDSKINCMVGYDEEKAIIYIESASVLGLKVIPKEKRHPVNLSSKGMGDLIKAIQNDCENRKLKVEKIVVGIGGTGTNDLGIGMCSRLGLKLLDKDNNQLGAFPKNFLKAEKIIWSMPEFPFKFEVIVDVDNPLLGEKGATMVYGAQKGSTKQELQIIEKGFVNIVNILKNNKIDVLDKVISGAGGGLAAGFMLFLQSTKKMAYNFISDDLLLRESGEQADVIVTGEGAFDSQSLMKKGTGIILDLFAGAQKQIFLVCGKIDPKVKSKLHKNINSIEISKNFSSVEESINNFNHGLKLACREIIKLLSN